MKKKLELINGCTATFPTVIPSNWRTGGKELLEKNWEIRYYFDDPVAKENDPELFAKKRRVRQKNMNEYKTLERRRAATEILISITVDKLVKEHYNPIYNTYMRMSDSKVDGYSTLISSLRTYLDFKSITPKYKDEISSMINFIEESCLRLNLHVTPVKMISRKNIKDILRDQQSHRNISNHRYNKYIAYLSSLFNDMIEDEIVEYNPVTKIKKLTSMTKVRNVLTNDDLKLIYPHLKENYYNFWRFTMIYYSSGARVTELLNLKVKDVDIKNSEFIVLVKKGSQYKQVVKPINKNYLYLWIEAISELNTDRLTVNQDHFLFSKNLQKGPKKIRYEQITRRWLQHVKNKLGVTADFASLTHLYMDNVSAVLDMKHAQKLRSHTSDKMVRKHYAINENDRQMQRLKDIDIPFYFDDNELS